MATLEFYHAALADCKQASDEACVRSISFSHQNAAQGTPANTLGDCHLGAGPSGVVQCVLQVCGLVHLLCALLSRQWCKAAVVVVS